MNHSSCLPGYGWSSSPGSWFLLSGDAGAFRFVNWTGSSQPRSRNVPSFMSETLMTFGNAMQHTTRNVQASWQLYRNFTPVLCKHLKCIFGSRNSSLLGHSAHFCEFSNEWQFQHYIRVIRFFVPKLSICQFYSSLLRLPNFYPYYDCWLCRHFYCVFLVYTIIIFHIVIFIFLCMCVRAPVCVTDRGMYAHCILANAGTLPSSHCVLKATVKLSHVLWPGH